MNKIRRHLCWLLKHRYRGIYFKPSHPEISDAHVVVADTEAGCIYCGHSEPNWFFMNIADIDWTKTKHRTEPPIHNVYNNPD